MGRCRLRVFVENSSISWRSATSRRRDCCSSPQPSHIFIRVLLYLLFSTLLLVSLLRRLKSRKTCLKSGAFIVHGGVFVRAQLIKGARSQSVDPEGDRVHAAAAAAGWKVTELQPAGTFSHTHTAPGGVVGRCSTSSSSDYPDRFYIEMQN